MFSQYSPLLILSLFALPMVAESATVTDCYDGACATITTPDCVAAGEPFEVELEGLLEEGNSFSVTAYGLFENSDWHYDEDHLFRLDSGEAVDIDGFNWGDTLVRNYTLRRSEGRYRYSFVFGDRSFSHRDISDAVAESEVVVGSGSGEPIAVDIKPGSCPNALNADRNGVISVALAGSDRIDITTIDPTSVRLAGLEPLHFDYQDVATPHLPLLDKEGEMACHTLGGDGHLDLVLKFRSRELVRALESELDRPLEAWEAVTVRVTADSSDGGAGGCGGYVGEDVVRILSRGGGRERR